MHFTDLSIAVMLIDSFADACIRAGRYGSKLCKCTKALERYGPPRSSRTAAEARGRG
jgi:hypothetical protein